MKRWWLSIDFLALLLASACSMTRSYDIAKQGVSTFHADLNGAQFDRILANASPEYQKSTNVERNRKLFSGIHRKLGDAGEWSLRSAFVNATTSGTFVRLECTTKFARGEAEESFVWRISGETVSLVSYKIYSPALISE